MTEQQYETLVDLLRLVNKNLYEIRKSLMIYAGVIIGILGAIALKFLWGIGGG